MLPKSVRPLTDKGRAMMERLKQDDVRANGLGGGDLRVMRALQSRHYAVPCASPAGPVWRITAEGRTADLSPPPPPPPKAIKSKILKRQNRNGDGVALNCPECHSIRLKVIDSRDHRGTKRRRRECIEGHRFWTMEVLANYDGDIIDPSHPEGYTA